MSVPTVFYSGHHSAFEKCKMIYRILKTVIFRPDMIAREMAKNNMTVEELDILRQLFFMLKDILKM